MCHGSFTPGQMRLHNDLRLSNLKLGAGQLTSAALLPSLPMTRIIPLAVDCVAVMVTAGQ